MRPCPRPSPPALRQLSLLRVETAMSDVPHNHHYRSEHAIARNENLRQALSLLLRTGAQKLTVLDAGNVVGVLTLEHIRNSARMGEPADLSTSTIGDFIDSSTSQ